MVDNKKRIDYTNDMEKYIKDFAKSLTLTDEKEYEECYMIRASLTIYEKLINGQVSMEVSKIRDNRRVSIIQSRMYSSNKLISVMSIEVIKSISKHYDISRKNNNVTGKFWRKFTRSEVIDFSRDTKDKNKIHLMDKPVVQGLLIMSYLCDENIKTAEIKFIHEIYCDEDIYIFKDNNIIYGYVNNILCFKCKQTYIQ